MWLDVARNLDAKMRRYVAERNLRYGVFLVFSGILWAAQVEGYIEFQLLMPGLLGLAGLLMIAEGFAMEKVKFKQRKLTSVKKRKKRKR